jgi:hypothetical protein
MKVLLVVALVLFAFGTCLAQAQPRPAGADSVKSYKLCPKCGVANLPEALFCYSCGAAFEAGAIPAVLPEGARADTSRAGVCPACGAVELPEAQFCSHCGAPFTETPSPGPHQKVESGLKKQPVLAFGLSLVLPGAGQAYNEQPGKGLLFLGGVLAGWGIGIMSAWNNGHSESNSTRIWFILGAASWVGSVIDAGATASELNRRRGYSALTSPGVGLVFVPDPRNPRRLQPGVGLRAGF